MKHFTLALIMCVFANTLSAQYIYYRQKQASLVKVDQPASSIREEKSKATPAVKADPVKEEARVETPKEKVYQTYVDKCPGVAGATPWLLSYVPELTKKILEDKYKGYLISIKGVMQQDGTILYYCGVCSEGLIKTEYALEDGTKVNR